VKLRALLFFALALAYQITTLKLYRLDGVGLPHWFSPVDAVGPDFLLILLAYFAVLDRSLRVFGAAIGAGLAQSELSLDPWLAPALSYLILVWLLRLAAEEGWTDGAFPRFLFASLAMAAASTARLGVLWLGEPEFHLPGLPSLALEALYNTLLGLVLFPILDHYRRHLLLVPARKLVACE
jgi:hypothetical protein